MIQTCPLMCYTYSRLGATLGSPKLRLLSVSVSPTSLLSPFPSVLSLQSRKLSLDLSLFSRVLLCAAPLPTARRSCPSPIPSPSVFARILGRSPSLQKRSRSPRLPENSITPVTRVALLRGAPSLAVTGRDGGARGWIMCDPRGT